MRASPSGWPSRWRSPSPTWPASGRPIEQPSGPAAQGSPVADDLELHPSATAGAGARASLDAALRQQPAPGRAAGRGAERAGGRGAGARAPRLAGAGAAHRDRGPAEGRPAARARRDLVARTRHRHGRHRSRRADRGAAVGRERPSTDRPIGSSHRRGERGHHLPEVPRRPARLRGRHGGDDARARWSRRATRATRSTCSRSRSSRWPRWTAGRWTSCSRWFAAPPRLRT